MSKTTTCPKCNGFGSTHTTSGWPKCPTCNGTGQVEPKEAKRKQEANQTEVELEEVLQSHAEYYIRETMKFFQYKGESPALSKNNEGDLVAKYGLRALIERERAEAVRAYAENISDWCVASGGREYGECSCHDQVHESLSELPKSEEAE